MFTSVYEIVFAQSIYDLSYKPWGTTLNFFIEDFRYSLKVLVEASGLCHCQTQFFPLSFLNDAFWTHFLRCSVTEIPE